MACWAAWMAVSISAGPAPACAPGAVLDGHAHLRQLLADGVGAGEVARLARGIAFGDQRIDLFGADARLFAGGPARLPEPFLRILLQQSQERAGCQQLTLGCPPGRHVTGPPRLGRDGVQVCERLRRVEV